MQFTNDFRNSQATSSIYAELVTVDQDATRIRECRVCQLPIGDASYWYKSATREASHVACGWFGSERVYFAPGGDVRPVQRTRPGTDFTFLEWQCPSCGLDACSSKAPIGGEDRRCKRCRKHDLTEGVVVRCNQVPSDPVYGHSRTMRQTTRFSSRMVSCKDGVGLYSITTFASDRARVAKMRIGKPGEVVPYAWLTFLEGPLRGHQVLVGVDAMRRSG